jgi:hypothetical protein
VEELEQEQPELGSEEDLANLMARADTSNMTKEEKAMRNRGEVHIRMRKASLQAPSVKPGQSLLEAATEAAGNGDAKAKPVKRGRR